MSDIDPMGILDELPSDAAHNPGDRYTPPGPRDVLRRIVDLLIDDVVAYNGRARVVVRVGWSKRNPSECYVVFDPEGHPEDIDPATNNPRAYRHLSETRLRVLRSSWTAPQ
jgi:hypothetical protein